MITLTDKTECPPVRGRTTLAVVLAEASEEAAVDQTALADLAVQVEAQTRSTGRPALEVTT